jgi:hypothetical protein
MTVKVMGTNFPTQAAILWNGAALNTTAVNANTLSATVGSSSLASPGTAQLKVQNTQTMQESQAVQVTIASANSGSPLTIAISSLPQGVVSVPYTGTFSATGGVAPYTWSITSGQLPPGLNLAANTGIISGTPTSSGNYSFAITVTDSGSSMQSATTTVSVPIVAAPVTPTPLTINSTSIPSGTLGSAYSTLLQASGGTAPYTWSFTSGSLPTGLSLAATTGVISGTPTASGTFNFTVTAADAGNPAQAKSLSFSLVISPVGLAITTSSLSSGTVGSTYSSLLQASGGTAPYSWSITGGSLPGGLALTAANGVITGTPTTSGTFSITATVSDAGNPAQTKSATLSLVIAPVPLTIATSTLPSATQSSGYSSSLQATGGTAPYTWSITSGALPAGLTLSANNGVISGTPTASGSFTIGATVKDAGSPSQTTTATVTLSVVAAGTPLAIASSTLPGGTPNQGYSATLNATGGTAPYTWSITNGVLPTGLSLTPATGTISGTPTASSTSSLTFNVVDSSSPAQAKSVTLSLVVAPIPLVLSTSTVPSGTNGTAYASLLQASGGTTPYTWSISVGSLPAGLTLAPATGLISGTPTAAGTSNFNATVTDSGNPAQTKSVALSLVVAAPAPPTLTINATLVSGTVNTAYSSTMTATGGTPAYTWSITSGSLPAGLTLAATTGIISGTPSTSGTYNFTATVTDNGSPAQTSSAATSIVVAPPVPTGPGTTWYVRSDGGTPYTAGTPSGQCDGQGNAPYPGTGTNQHCAFNDIRYLWTNGAFCNDGTSTSTCWKWVIAGGDTAIVRDCIQYSTVSPFPAIPGSSGSCDIGQQGPGASDWGISLAGDPNNSGWPVPPNGGPNAHTKILGANYASCSAQSARTLINGSYGVGEVFKMEGASYVDVACFDVTDFSSCGRSGQLNQCSTTPGSLSNFAAEGIGWSNTSTNDTVTDVRIHGMASLGMFGPTGDGVVMTRVALIGNAGAGWNADKGDGLTGTGSLLVQNFTISWNGCAEEYPIVDALPYQDCTDDNIGGYGDGFGTATVPSPAPGWQAHFDQGEVSYNTQDGLDALHLVGGGSSMTVTRTLAYGNMGQQIKVGGASGAAINNVVFTNCNALRQAIPGTPSGYNTRLSDFCRAADSGIVMTVGKGTTLSFDFNTVYSASATGIEVDCDTSSGPCDSTSLIDFRNNIFVGFLNNTADGYPNGGTSDYSNPIYVGVATTNPFTNAGSIYSNNVTYNAKSDWTCPAQWLNEVNALCTNPNLMDPTWHLYGYGNVAPNPSVQVVQGAGVAIPTIPIDYTGQVRSNPPSIGAYEQ